MAITYTYRSAGLAMFDAWLTGLILFLGCLFLTWYFNFNFGAILLSSFSIAAIYFLIRIGVSISIIKRVNNQFTFKDIRKEIVLDGIEASESWWSYEFMGDSREFNGDFFGEEESKGHTNKINIYVRLSSGKQTVILREQIHMSEKFPNNYQYKVSVPVDEKYLFKVWDIDKCCQRLKLNGLLKR